MDYELYHDESREGGYWHGMLLVPNNSKLILLELLAKARQKTGHQEFLTFKKTRGGGPGFECKRIWIHLAVLGLRSKLGKEPEYVDWGKLITSSERFEKIDKLIGLKFILFRDVDHFANMSKLLDFGGKVETTCRIGLKGGLHYLGSEEHPINITKIHFDGYLHYRRHINQDRLIGRLNGLRNYVSISSRDDLIDDRSSNPKSENSQSFEDCELLQLTDLLIGSFRSVILGTDSIYKKIIAYPTLLLMGKLMQGYTRMSHSRWANSFCASQCFLDSDKWDFETIEIRKDEPNLQQPLPF